MRNHWTDERTIDERTIELTDGERTIEDDLGAARRERNPDSSVAAQYEDSFPPDPQGEDEYEPS